MVDDYVEEDKQLDELRRVFKKQKRTSVVEDYQRQNTMLSRRMSLISALNQFDQID